MAFARPVQDSVDRDRVEDGPVQPSVFVEGGGVGPPVGSRHPPALPRVVPPLPVEVDGDDDPEPDLPGDENGGQGDDGKEVRDQPTPLLEARPVEADPGEGGDHVMVSEDPDIQEQDRVEQRRLDHDHRPGEEREPDPPEDERAVEAGVAEPRGANARPRDFGALRPRRGYRRDRHRVHRIPVPSLSSTRSPMADARLCDGIRSARLRGPVTSQVGLGEGVVRHPAIGFTSDRTRRCASRRFSLRARCRIAARMGARDRPHPCPPGDGAP